MSPRAPGARPGALAPDPELGPLSQFLDAAPDGMLVVDERGGIVLVNQQAAEMFGFERSELLGRVIEDLVPPRLREGHERHRKTFNHDPRRRPMGEGLALWAARKDGSEFPVEISLSPITAGAATMVIAAVRDVSGRRRIDQELQRRSMELEVSNRELEAFSHSVSHDLNNPLRTIEGFTHLLLARHRHTLDADVVEMLERVHAASEQMARLIQSLQVLSHVTRREMVPETVDLSALARQILKDMAESDPLRTVDAQVHDGLVAAGDPALLRIVLANLLGNAWKYTRPTEDPRIEVGATTIGRERAFFVRDNGVGFDPERMDRLFVPFGRLHDQVEFEGTGIGLATVQRIVRRHGGRAWAEGKTAGGATFYFTLPASESAFPPEPGKSRDRKPR